MWARHHAYTAQSCDIPLLPIAEQPKDSVDVSACVKDTQLLRVQTLPPHYAAWWKTVCERKGNRVLVLLCP
jgi:hypothetical protein